MSSISKTSPPYAAHPIIQEAESKRTEPAKKSGKAVAPASFERNQRLADQFLEHVSATPPKSTKDLDQIFLKVHGGHHKLQTSAYDGTHTCCDLGLTYSALREKVHKEEANREFLTTSPHAKSIAIPLLGTRGSVRELLQDTRQTQELFQKKYGEHLDLCRPKARASAHEWVKAQPVIQKIIEKQKAEKKYGEIFRKSYEVNIKNFEPEYAEKLANRLVESKFMKDLKAQTAYIKLFQVKEEAFELASKAGVPLLLMQEAREYSPRNIMIQNARAVEEETPKIVASIADQILMDLIGEMVPELNAIDARRQARASKDPAPAAAPASSPPLATKTTTPA